jgi:hypothetical protein
MSRVLHLQGQGALPVGGTAFRVFLTPTLDWHPILIMLRQHASRDGQETMPPVILPPFCICTRTMTSCHLEGSCLQSYPLMLISLTQSIEKELSWVVTQLY